MSDNEGNKKVSNGEVNKNGIRGTNFAFNKSSKLLSVILLNLRFDRVHF